MKRLLLFSILISLCVAAAADEDVVIENVRCRLVLSSGGYAKSLVDKTSGAELLAPQSNNPNNQTIQTIIPFSSVGQNRAYDNELHLMYAAKPMTWPCNHIERTGNLLRMRYRDEFFTAVVAIEERDDYIGFRLVRIDYETGGVGYKRRTEIDSLVLAQLPVRRRAHFGRTLNVTWDDRAAVALMAGNLETRIDAAESESSLVFTAGGEKAVAIDGLSAVLAVAKGPESFLDCVDSFERDYALPRGVRSRRDPLYAASYLTVSDLTPENAAAYAEIAETAGLRAVMTYGLRSLWQSNGHFVPQAPFAEGPTAFRRATDAFRAKGILPGLHFFCTKVTTNDLYLVGGHPDSRLNTVCELTLAHDIGATETVIPFEEHPRLLRREANRGLVQIGDELVMYGGFTTTSHSNFFALTNCVRGLWGSRPTAHPRNTVARHLDVDDWVLFVRCGDNAIVDEMADRLKDWYDAAGIRFCYMDGAEDVPEPFWYHVPRVQMNVYRRFASAPLWSETSLKSHFGWHIQSRGNAFDIFKGERQREAMRRYILKTARQDADDFSAVNLGWLQFQPPCKPTADGRNWETGHYAADATGDGTIGTQIDVFEYVCAKAAAWNCPIALGMTPADVRTNPTAVPCLKAVKRWEDAKLGRRFTSAQREMLKDENREWFLWPFAPEGEVELVEYRQVTADSEETYRAFSYVRNGRAGLVYWRLDGQSAPQLEGLPSACSFRRDAHRVFVEGPAAEDVLVSALAKILSGRPLGKPMSVRAKGPKAGATDEIVFENAVARLVFGTNGLARSLVLKETGVELLAQPARTPFAVLTHARPYAKVAQLAYPAQQREFPANRLVRKGDGLEVGFADTRDTIDVRVSVFPDRFTFAFGGFGISESAMDPKWTWRPEAVRFARFAVAPRAHFGEWMNVVWDDSASVALMGLSAETRMTGERDGLGVTLSAGGEIDVGYDGLAATLIPAQTPKLLDAVDRMERACGLPLGVAARRSVWANASYFWARDVTPTNVDALVSAAKRGGFPLFMISYTAFAKTCGHYLWNESYPNGLADLRAVCDRVRAAGLVPGLHMHYSKVSRDDPYVAAADPDTRFNVISTFYLARGIGADETEIPLQARPVNWNPEDGRRLVQIGREWVAFEGVSAQAPWRLVGCTRGFLGSTAAAHAANDPVRHVDVDNWIRFIRLDAASSIVDEIAGRLGALYRDCGFRFAYFDGAEDVPQPYWYHVTRAQQRVWAQLSPAPVVAETYVKNHFGWHMFARGNAFDPYKSGQMIAAYRRYQEPCMREARENFTTVDLGWADLVGKTPEEFAFLLARAREWNAPVALWTGLKEISENPDSDRILEMFRNFNEERK